MRHALAARLVTTAVVLGAAATAFGEDFTFTVPINVTAIPEHFTEAGALCKVQDASDSIGQGEATLPLANGRASGNAVVKLNVNPGKNPAAARTYYCLLYFKRANGTVHAPSASDVKPGTTSTLIRRGDLPQ